MKKSFVIRLFLLLVSPLIIAIPHNGYDTDFVSAYPTTLSPLNTLIVRGDLDGDGLEDLVIGGTNHFNTTLKTPIKIMKNNGMGGLIDITSTFIYGSPTPVEFYQPFGHIADFDHDGINDLMIFDRGRKDRALNGSYFGGVPTAFYSTASGIPGSLKWVNTVNQALINYRTAQVNPINCGGTGKYYNVPSCDIWIDNAHELDLFGNDHLHSKFQSLGDINGDGYLDIYVEAGGGFGQLHNSLFFINTPSNPGYFTVSTNLISDEMIYGPGGPGVGSWRHYNSTLVDVNNDSCVDLVLGKLGNIQSGVNPDHDILFSKIFLNDCNGTFPEASVIQLPNPTSFEQGAMAQATVVIAVESADLDGNGLKDLVLVHTRGTDGENLGNTPWTATGRYVQIFMQTSPLFFEDQTDTLLDPQDAYTRIDLDSNFCHDPLYSGFFDKNYNAPKQIRLIDFNADGHLDIVMEKVDGNLHPDYSPLAYVWDNGRYYPYSPQVLAAPNYFYFTGAGLAVLNLYGDLVFDFALAGPYTGTPAAPLHGLYKFIANY